MITAPKPRVRVEGSGPKYSPVDPQYARKIVIKLPANFQVIDGGYYIDSCNLEGRKPRGG